MIRLTGQPFTELEQYNQRGRKQWWRQEQVVKTSSTSTVSKPNTVLNSNPKSSRA